MADNRPIGVFDSGVGGLSVWREIVRQLPRESTIYVADSAHCPYGPRPAAEIIQFSTEITRFLLAQGAKMIVVACNTASAAALKQLRATFDVPVVGMEPAVKPAAQATRTGHIGVLATEGTFQGELFNRTTRTYARHVMVHRQVAHGLVSLVEGGDFSGAAAESLLRRHLLPLMAANVDQLVLGCTHYPFLLPLMRQIVGAQMEIIDPADAVAKQVRRVLDSRAACADGASHHRFFSSGDTQPLKKLLAHVDCANAEINRVQWQTNSPTHVMLGSVE